MLIMQLNKGGDAWAGARRPTPAPHQARSAATRDVNSWIFEILQQDTNTTPASASANIGSLLQRPLSNSIASLSLNIPSALSFMPAVSAALAPFYSTC